MKALITISPLNVIAYVWKTGKRLPMTTSMTTKTVKNSGYIFNQKHFIGVIALFLVLKLGVPILKNQFNCVLLCFFHKQTGKFWHLSYSNS